MVLLKDSGAQQSNPSLTLQSSQIDLPRLVRASGASPWGNFDSSAQPWQIITSSCMNCHFFFCCRLHSSSPCPLFLKTKWPCVVFRWWWFCSRCLLSSRPFSANGSTTLRWWRWVGVASAETVGSCRTSATMTTCLRSLLQAVCAIFEKSVKTLLHDFAPMVSQLSEMLGQMYSTIPQASALDLTRQVRTVTHTNHFFYEVKMILHHLIVTLLIFYATKPLHNCVDVL